MLAESEPGFTRTHSRMTANKALSGLFVLVTAGFILGLGYLFQLRYRAGDVYPAYSSLRADPLGTKAFFDALAKAGDRTVRRNLHNLEQLDLPADTTVFCLGLGVDDISGVPEQEFNRWEKLARGGGRLVLSILPGRDIAIDAHQPMTEKNLPVTEPNDDDRSEADNKAAQRRPPGARERRAAEPRETETRNLVAVPIRWGFEMAYGALPITNDGAAGSVPVHRRPDGALPSELTWHSGIVFSQLSDDWRVIYARDAEAAVVMERRFGRGSIVLLSDSYLVSNEAMRMDRQPELLAWLAGRHRTIVFDETHLGVTENPGVMTLARKYRLHGLFVGLSVLAVVFVWKSAVPFAPGPEEPRHEPAHDIASGRDSSAGLVNMLRRSIPAGTLSSVCFEQWKAGHLREKARAKLERMEAVVQAEQALPARERNPVATYQKLTCIWNERGK
jgi:hypothetical protein